MATPSTLQIWWRRNRSIIYIIPAVIFLIAAAILDKVYLSPDIQIPLITGLIVAVFSLIILSIPLVSYYARGDNYIEGHLPQRDEPLDLPFHGGHIIETPLNYDPDNKEDMAKIEAGELIPRHDIPLMLTEEKDLSDVFPQLGQLGIETVTTVHFRYYLHWKDRFDLSTGAIVVRKGVPLYHPHAEEVFMWPAGVDYYDGIPNPVFEVMFTRKGDYDMLSSPIVMDLAFAGWGLVTRGTDPDKIIQKWSEIFKAVKPSAQPQAQGAAA